MRRARAVRRAASARRRAPPRLASVVAGLVLLGACAPVAREPPPEVEASRAYERQSRDDVFARTVAALDASGLQVVAADEDRGLITAVERGFEERGWAECPRVRVTSRDDSRRFRQAQPLDREVELTATVTETAAGATLTLDPAFVERQLNSFTNLSFDQRCRSTGALERQLFEAVAR